MQPRPSHLERARRCVWALLLVPFLALPGQGVGAQPLLDTVAVFSFLGDGVQITAATDAPSDTRIERTARETVEFKDIGFDLIALRVAREALQRAQPAARVLTFRSPQALNPQQQRELAQGAARAELPDWMVQAIEQRKLTHLLLITRSRGAIDVRTGDGDGIGRGTVEGIGFYMDTFYRMRNTETGALSAGLLAPHTEILFQLMDARSGEILRRHEIKESFAFAAPEDQVAPEPWTFMSAAEKVTILRQMVEKGTERALQQLLAKS